MKSGGKGYEKAVNDIFVTNTDEELALLAQGGNEDASEYLIRKYKDEVRGKCHLYFMMGADNDDIIQEGMIGLFKAIMSYDRTREAAFKTFAELCVNRQIITAVKRAGRQKHSPLNTSVSIHNPLDGNESGKSIADTLRDKDDLNPEELLLLKEEMDYLEVNGREIFSDLELKVWNEYRQGRSYTQIAENIGRNAKAIDNAIQRMRKKVEQRLGFAR
jgi:RNA polymerase sporulation-specific sigma factor